MLSASASIAATPNLVDHTFAVRPPEGIHIITVVGSFNEWSTTRNKFTDPDRDGIWSARVSLLPGTYEYKFVLNGVHWIDDPSNPETREDGLGGRNSILRLVENSSISPDGPAPESVALTPAPASYNPQRTVIMRLAYSAPRARSVHLAGDFNNWLDNLGGQIWGHEDWRMIRDTSGVWRTELELPEGEYQFKYAIDYGYEWQGDPHYPPLPMGNSMLVVKSDGSVDVIRNGRYSRTSENGGFHIEGNYSDGRRDGRWKILDTDGNLREEVGYHQGLRVDTWITYFQEKFPEIEAAYHAGALECFWRRHYPTGEIVEEGIVSSGKRTGSWRTLSKTGIVLAEGLYSANVRHGSWKFYYDNGTIESMGEYRDGKRTGTWHHYDGDGRISSMVTAAEAGVAKGVAAGNPLAIEERLSQGAE